MKMLSEWRGLEFLLKRVILKKNMGLGRKTVIGIDASLRAWLGVLLPLRSGRTRVATVGVHFSESTSTDN